ncbi:MAG: hypothetical protein H6590_06145 [Flavobacteriales bacterium]|nr:hypothetical protein [Flavobacteriales bacterium]
MASRETRQMLEAFSRRIARDHDLYQRARWQEQLRRRKEAEESSRRMLVSFWVCLGIFSIPFFTLLLMRLTGVL